MAMSDIDRAELRRLLDEAPPLPWRYREHGYQCDGYQCDGPTSVVLEAKPFEDGWEAIAVGDYDQWSGYGVALSVAAVNALPGLLDALEKAEGHRDSLAAKLDAAIDVAHLDRQQAWSAETFGPAEVRGHRGVLDHIRKELVEIEAEPGDVTEWADLIILAFDGAWRSGHTPADTIAAIKTKQERNEGRQWPDWRTADPDKAIEHVRALDATPETGCES